MTLSLFIIAASSLTVLLRFDGSLRPPADPIPGFTYSTNVIATSDSSKQLEGSGKLASCSAAISTSHCPNANVGGHEEERLIAIGGRYLPILPGLTSADTEYDGLLLGLEWLVQHAFSSEKIIQELCNNDEQLLLESKLIIRGDCKAVIDQLESRSVPRKTEEKYNLAMDRIESLKELYAKSICEKNSASQELKICFEHVPRENNHFCDALCKLVINQKQVLIIESIQKLIRVGEEDAKKNAVDNRDQHSNRIDKNNNIKQKRKNKSKKKGTGQPKSDYFQQALDSIRYTAQLCHSSRLALACELAKASARQKDAAILNDLSDFFLHMSRRWSRIYYGGNDEECSSWGRGALRKVSIGCKNLSKHFSGDILGDDQLFYDEIQSVFDFCTMSKLTKHEEVNVDSTFDVTMLKPYNVVVSGISSCVGVKFWRDELLAWNEIASENWKEAGHTKTSSSVALNEIWSTIDIP